MDDMILEMDTGQDDLDLETDIAMVRETDYNELTNLPQINSVTLTGNQFLADLFPDGIIINGGDSTGYTPPVVPTGIPHAEGVGF